MKVYYAHHKMKYNTEIEKYELELIASKMKQEEYIRGNHNEKLLKYSGSQSHIALACG